MNLKSLKRFIKDEKGQSVVEYSILIGLVAFMVVGALSVAGRKVNNTFRTAGQPMTTQLASAGSGIGGTQMNVAQLPSAELHAIKKIVPRSWDMPWQQTEAQPEKR